MNLKKILNKVSNSFLAFFLVATISSLLTRIYKNNEKELIFPNIKHIIMTNRTSTMMRLQQKRKMLEHLPFLHILSIHHISLVL